MNLRTILKDKLVLGALAGVTADITQDIIQFGLEKLNLIKYNLDSFACSMFIRVNNTSIITEHLGIIIGKLSGAAHSVILGIIFVYLIKLSGIRFILSKGLLYGFILWFIIFGGIRAALHVSYLQDYDPLHTLIFFFVHLLFGLVLGLVVKLGYLVIKD